MRSLSFLRDLGPRFCSGYPIQRRDDGRSFVPIASLTFSSSIIPIQMELRPKAEAANWEYAAARVASWIENLARISCGKFSLTRSGFIQNTRTTGVLT